MSRGRRSAAQTARLEPAATDDGGFRVTTTDFAVIQGRGVRCVLLAEGNQGPVRWSLDAHPAAGDAAEAALPPGMHLDTHGITGVPEVPGVYIVDVVAEDQAFPQRQRATAAVTVTVEPSDLPVPATTRTIHLPAPR